MEIPKKIVWLASYPKSGNTWFRAFLTALLNDGEININNLKTEGIFSSRDIFYQYTDLDSRYFTDAETKIMQPDIFNYLALIEQKERVFIKVHDAYTYNQNNKPIIPTDSSICAVYIIRNPLDIAASFANHINKSIDEAIISMNNPEGSLSTQKNNLNVKSQTKQLLLDWSSHVKSWTNNLPFPVMVIRYEDMLSDPIKTFSDSLKFIGIQAKLCDINYAINSTSFEKLKETEAKEGFIEAKLNPFFRKGKSGSWQKELTNRQIDQITGTQKSIMKLYGYFN